MKIEKFAPSLSNMFRAFCEEYWPESNSDEAPFFMDYCPKESLLESLDKKEDMSHIYMAIEENHCVGYFYYEKYKTACLILTEEGIHINLMFKAGCSLAFDYRGSSTCIIVPQGLLSKILISPRC